MQIQAEISVVLVIIKCATKKLKERLNTRHYFLSVLGINIYGPEHVSTGEKFEVYCNATGVNFPPEEIDWFFDGFKIKTDFDKGIIIEKSVSLKARSIESTIHIARAQSSDKGDYTCRVSNGLVKTINVRVLHSEYFHIVYTVSIFSLICMKLIHYQLFFENVKSPSDVAVNSWKFSKIIFISLEYFMPTQKKTNTRKMCSFRQLYIHVYCTVYCRIF